MQHAIGTVYLVKPCAAVEPYARLGRQMALPQTACLALPGPLGPVAGTPRGRAWFDEEDEAEATEVQTSSGIGICCCSNRCTACSATAPWQDCMNVLALAFVLIGVSMWLDTNFRLC